MPDNISKLYNELKETYELGSEDDFRKYLSDSKNREALRKELESEYDVGDEAAFSSYLGFGQPQQAVQQQQDSGATAVSQAAPVQQSTQQQSLYSQEDLQDVHQWNQPTPKGYARDNAGRLVTTRAGEDGSVYTTPVTQTSEEQAIQQRMSQVGEIYLEPESYSFEPDATDGKMHYSWRNGRRVGQLDPGALRFAHIGRNYSSEAYRQAEQEAADMTDEELINAFNKLYNAYGKDSDNALTQGYGRDDASRMMAYATEMRYRDVGMPGHAKDYGYGGQPKSEGIYHYYAAKMDPAVSSAMDQLDKMGWDQRVTYLSEVLRDKQARENTINIGRATDEDRAAYEEDKRKLLAGAMLYARDNNRLPEDAYNIVVGAASNATPTDTGFWNGIKFTTGQMWRDVKYFFGEAANLIADDRGDVLDAISALDKYGEDAETKLAAGTLHNMGLLGMILFDGDEANASEGAARILHGCIVRDKDGRIDIDATRAALMNKLKNTYSWGDRIMRDNVYNTAMAKQVEGDAAWWGQQVAQLVPSAAAIAVGVTTRNPMLAEAIGQIGMGYMCISSGANAMQEARLYGASDGQVWTAGIVNAALEYVTEKLPFDRYTKRVFGEVKATSARKLMDAVTDINNPAHHEIQQLLEAAKKELGNGKLVKAYAGDILAEGSSEFAAGTLQKAVEILYKRPEDYPTFMEILEEGIESFKGGAAMGGIMGSISTGTTYIQADNRRKKAGVVTVGIYDSGDGMGVPIEIIAKDNNGNYVAIDGQHQEVIVNPDEVKGVVTYTYDEWKKGEAQYRQDENYNEGYNAPDEEQPGVKERVDVAGKRLQEAFGWTDEDYNLFTDPNGHYDLSDPAWLDLMSEDKRAAVEEYLEARAAFEGMLQHVQDDMEGAIAESEAAVDAQTHPETGAVHHAVLKTGGEVWVVGGNVALTPEGNIDIENSDGDLIVFDPATGGKRMIHVSDLASADEPVMADQLKQEAAATIKETMATEAANRIDGALPFQPGDVYTLPFGEEQHTITIIGDAGDGVNTVVSVDGGEQQLMPMQMIQEAADAQREARIAEQAAINGGAAVDNREGVMDNEAPAGTAAQPQPTGQEDAAPADDEASQSDAIPEQEAAEEEQPDDDAMPMNGDEVDWFATSPERGHRFLYDEAGLSPEEADAVVANSVKDAEKELEKVSKKAPKPGNAAQLNKYRAEKAAHEQQVAAAQAAVDYWKGVQATQQQVVADLVRRQADERAAQDAAARQAAIEAEAQYQAEQEAKKAEQAERGPFTPGQNVIDKWKSAKKIDGRKDVKVLADGTVVGGHYVLHEAGATTPSHDPATGWKPTEGFPVNENGGSVNDRDYERDRAAQEITIRMSETFDGRAYQDVPIISDEGIDYSGNGRTIAGDMAARNNTDGAYLETARQYSEKYGFTAEDMDQFQHPRVDFMLDKKLPYTPEVFAKFNAQEMKGQNLTESAVKLGKTVDDTTFNDIVGLINQFDTMSDFYADGTAPAEAISMLLRAGVITPMQHAQMFDGDSVSGQGKEMLENLLLGKAFEGNPEAIRQIRSMPSVRQQIVGALAEVANNSTLGDYSLEDVISQAVALVHKARNDKNSSVKQGDSVSDYARQLSLFPNITGGATIADLQNTMVLLLGDILNGRGQLTFKNVLIKYNYSASQTVGYTGSFFTDASPDGLLKDAIQLINNSNKNEIKQEITAAVEQRKSAARQGSEPVTAVNTGDEGGAAGSGAEREAEGQQSDLASPEVSYQLSDEVDENGRQFVLTSNGELEFGQIGEDTGLTAAPILLSEGIITNPETNDGYGLVHIEARHGDQIRNAGYHSVIEFIEEVAKNYEVIRKGKDRNGMQTYMLQLTDKHNNTLIVELSGDGTYWNINTAGIFKTSYGAKREVVYNRHTTAKQPAETAGASLTGEQSGTTPETSMNAPTTSEGKGSTENTNVQGNSEKNVEAAVADAEAEVDTEPTDGQKEAGNYKKGHVKIDGFDVTIEQPKGSVRSGVDASGKAWSQEMHNTYGYIRGTEGVDGDHIDVFLSDHLDSWNGMVYVVDQVNKDGSFDEHKVMYGFDSEQEARDAYLSNYKEGWTGLGNITGVTRDEFKKWVDSSHRKTKPFAEYKSVKVSRPIQGLEGYTEDEILADVRAFIEEQLEDAGIEGVTIKGMALHGSRMRGDARPDSDLDVVVEYEGDISEDAFFNLVNYDLNFRGPNGIIIDINPITRGKSGTLEQYMERSRRYDEEKRNAGAASANETSQRGLAGMLAEDFKEELAGAKSSVEIVPDSAEDGPVEAVANVTVDGQPSNIWLASGEGRMMDEYWKLVYVPFTESEWQEIADLAEAYNKSRGKEVCRDDADVKRINFDSIDEAVAFERWRSKNEEKRSKTTKGGKFAASESPKKRIDDFGEKIGGARKDLARGRIRDAKKMSVKDLSALKKGADDILSQANVLKLYKDGQMDEATARQFMAYNSVIKSVLNSGLLKNIREIALEKYRDAAVAWEEGKPFSLEITDKDIQAYKLTRPNASDERARESLVYHITDPVSMHLATYEALNYPAEERKLGRYVIVDYSKMQSDHVTMTRHIWVKNGYGARRGYPFDNMDAAIEKMKKLCPVVETKEKKARGEKAEHGLRVVKEGYGYYIKSRNIPGNIYLSPRFISKKQAQSYLDDNLDHLKERERRLVDALLGSNIGMAEREGVDYRDGRDVTPQDFLDEFGFRGVEFGNWVPQGERQLYLNKTYDAIKDFCAIVGISPKAFSLGGRLGLAFGARGHSKAMAHYEPAKEVINLTRMSGVGSLAHEWFHAVDNYLAKQKTGNMSDMATVTHDVVRDELSSVFRELHDVMKSMDYHRRSRNAGEYWGRTEEEFARLFENYIYNKLAAKETTSPVLVRKDVLLDDVEEQMKSSWPYPSAEENAKMESYFDRLFDTIQEKTDENGNVVLFQKAEGSTISKDAAEREAALRDGLVEVLRGAGIEVVTDVEEGQRVLDAVNGRVQAMGFANSREEFDNTRDRAVAETGIVMTGLAEEEVTVVDVPRHDFTGVAPIKQAEAWGKKNLVTPKDKKGNHIDKPKLKDGTEYSISSNAVGKFLSKSATKNSDNLGVHLSVLKKLKDVIHESMEAEVHPDYKKDETGKRDPKNGYNPDYLVHRLYGAVDIDGKTYRVKTTIIENGNESRNYPHSYEVTEIELLDDSMAGSESHSVNIGREGHDTKNRLSNNSIAGANLLQGVEKSYDPGKKLLDESEKSTESGVNLHRVWHGSGAEFDTFDHSHMGEGEGAQAYGWGTYVTEVEDIGRRYAETAGGVRYKGHDVDELYEHSIDGMEDSERNAAWMLSRAMRTFGFSDAVERLRSLYKQDLENSNRLKGLSIEQTMERYGCSRADAKLYIKDAAAKAEMWQQRLDALEGMREEDFTAPSRVLYSVEIPEDTGDNYLAWDGNVSSRQHPMWYEAMKILGEQDSFMSPEEFIELYPGSEPSISVSHEMKYLEAKHSPKTVSEALHSAGFTGIVYPANYRSGGNRTGSKNYVIFDEADAQIVGREKFFRTADGTAYGFVRDGRIYIDPRIATSETPIHEYTHLWCAALRRVNPAAWSRLKEALLGQKDVVEHVKRLYPELEGDELMDEVFAHYSGRRGRERLQREQEREVAKAKGIFDKARVVAVFDRIRRALDNFWLEARHLFAGKSEGLEKLSAEDFADMAMADLMRGFNPTEEVRKLDADGRKAAQLRLVTDANAMTDTYHTGIRRIDDIKTYEEAVAEGEGIGSYPDFTEEDARAALDRGRATVYSSHPIEPGSFVSMSRMEAEEYAGGGEVYSQEVPLEDVAWIYANEGQYAPVGDGGGATAHGTRTQRTAPTHSENFKRWFGDWESDPENASKVVDENGEPKVVLHGTPNGDFYVFDSEKAGSNTDQGWLGTGFYFYGNAPEYASQYAGKNGRVLQVYLDIKNPYIASVEESNRLAEANDPEMSRRFREQLEDEGYDGVFYNGDLNEEWVAFRPEQIKSATENNGEFDPNNPDMRLRDALVEGGRLAIINQGGKWRIEGMPGEFGSRYAAIEEWRERAAGNVVWYMSEDGNHIEVEGNGDMYEMMSLDTTTNGRKQRERMARQQATRSASGRRMVDELADKLGVKVRYVDDMTEEERAQFSDRQLRGKGWYNPRTGEVFINLGRHTRLYDILSTFLHETVAHKGLRRLFGKDFNTFVDNVYNNVNKGIRAEIDRMAEQQKSRASEAQRARHDDEHWRRVATEEYMAKLAERLDLNHPEQRTLWEKIRGWLIDHLRKVGVMVADSLNDNDLRGILWESYHNMQMEGVVGYAKGKAFRDQMEREAVNAARSAAHETTPIAAESVARYTGSLFDILPQAGAWARMMSNMSERELFSEMAQDGPNVTSSYTEEYDRRHIREYNQACDEIQAQLERELPGEDRLLELLQDAEAQWAEGAYKDSRRTGVLAAIDTISRALDEERADLPRVEEDVQAEGSQYTNSGGVGLLGESDEPYNQQRANDIVRDFPHSHAVKEGFAAFCAVDSEDALEQAIADNHLTDEEAEDLREKYNDPGTLGCALREGKDLIAIFTHKLKSLKDLEEANAHETMHIAYGQLGREEHNKFNNAILNWFRSKSWGNKFIDALQAEHDPKDWADETMAYFVGHAVKKHGWKKFFSGKVNYGNEEINNFVSRIKEIIINEEEFERLQDQSNADAGRNGSRGRAQRPTEDNNRLRQPASVREAGEVSLTPASNKTQGQQGGRANGEVAPSDEDLLFNDSEDDVDVAGFDAGRLTFEEKITAGMLKAAADNRAAIAARTAAMRELGGNLSKLRQAMARQREYDRGTVDSIVRLARSVMESGFFRGFSPYEVKRLMSLINHAAGREDITKQAGKVVDLLLKHQLKECEEMLDNLESVKGIKVDSRGVVVQGVLDPTGNIILKTFKESRSFKEEKLNQELERVLDLMGSSDEAIADDAASAYAGLQFALMYHSGIRQSKEDEHTLRQELKALHDEADRAERRTEDYRQKEASLESAILHNYIERIKSYTDMLDQLADRLSGSVQRAKEFKEAEKRRVREIQHFANSDMEGRELRGHRSDSRLEKLNNFAPVRFVLNPLSNLDQFLRMLGGKNANGKGYLWDKFMRGWIDSADNEQLWKEKYNGMLDAKAAEIFGGHKVIHKGMKEVPYRYMDLYGYADALPHATVSYFDGAAMRDYELSQSQLLYFYAVDKMPMGKATNRKMGISDEVMERIGAALDPKLKAFADWAQEELLPQLGNEMNTVHKKMFGANMASIENYFPFVRDKSAVKREVENGRSSQPNDRISTTTGAIKKRTANVYNWDIPNCNFFDVLAQHISEGCHWATFAELNRDFGTLLSYKRFEQQVRNMNTVYGNGDKLWNLFCNLCAITTDAYEPKRSNADELMVRMAKGVSLSKIAFNPMPAMKQLLSLPAFVGEIEPQYLAKDLGTVGVYAVKWAWESMPNYRKRVLSRTVGDYYLRNSEYDDRQSWIDSVQRLMSKGMLPNIGVDAWVIAVGAHGVYQTAKAKYLRQGYSEEKAERRAIQDAELCFNKSQQSSEGPFLAPIQVDHTFLSTTAMLFRNASTSYSRETVASARNLRRMISGEVDVDFMAKQLLRTSEVPTYSQRFDAELQQQIAGDLPTGHVYRLGLPGGVLQSAGFPDMPIELLSTRLSEKANNQNHPFPLEAVKGLVEAMNNPLAVFRYGNNAMNVIVGLEYKGKQFLIGVHFNQNYRGTEVSDVRGLFPKDNAEWLNWISQGKATYLDHKKIQALIKQQRINLAEVTYLDLESVANIINNFVNPDIPEQKKSRDWTEEDWNRAREHAKKELRIAYISNFVNVNMFGWMLPWLWRIGGIAPLLLLGGDDDDKKKQKDEAKRHNWLAPLEGLAYGDVISDFGITAWDKWVLGDKDAKLSNIGRDNPFYSDLSTILRHADNDMLQACNDMFNILVSMVSGASPQMLANWVSAFLDKCGGDKALANEWALLVARLLNVPQSQLDKIFFKEIGLTGAEASHLSADEIAERFARYKVRRGYMFTPWVWDDEGRLKKKKDSASDVIKGSLDYRGIEILEDAYLKSDAYLQGLIETVVKKKVTELSEDSLVSLSTKAKTDVVRKAALEEYYKLVGDSDTEKLRKDFEKGDSLVRKVTGSEIAKRQGARQDTYGKKPNSNWGDEAKSYWIAYQNLRLPDDIDEDAMISQAIHSEPNGDDIQKDFTKINDDIKKQLGQGDDDEKIMQRYREARRELIKKYSLQD